MIPARFRRIVYAHYATNGRDLAWRKTRDPYHIVVSEIMLQQTQVPRVVEKYPVFIKKFPTITSLAAAPLSQVLAAWQGLGYNRRALLLQKLAQKVVAEHAGKVPRDVHTLETLPGIGKATAGSIAAFAFNRPSVFIETNIRSVFIHCFFPNRRSVSDEELLPVVAKAIDVKNPRKWYNALMDYGVYLKEREGNPSRKSAHYTRQSRFEGSNRQLRGKILKELLKKKTMCFADAYTLAGSDPARAKVVIESLVKDRLVRVHNSRLLI